MLFFFQQAQQQAGTYVPLWVAIVAGVATLISSLGLGGLILFFVQRSKFFSEVKGQEIKNKGDQLKNVDIENETLNTAYEMIDKYRKENLRIGDDLHEKTKQLEMKGYQLAEERGMRIQAIADRDKVFERIRKLESDVIFEKNQCQQQIIDLGLKYEAKLRWTNRRVDVLIETLHNSDIEVPAEVPYDEQAELKGLITNDTTNNT